MMSVSLEPETRKAPVESYLRAVTALRWWPRKVDWQVPVRMSHRRMVPSEWPTAIWEEMGEGARWVTSPGGLLDCDGGGMSV